MFIRVQVIFIHINFFWNLKRQRNKYFFFDTYWLIFSIRNYFFLSKILNLFYSSTSVIFYWNILIAYDWNLYSLFDNFINLYFNKFLLKDWNTDYFFNWRKFLNNLDYSIHYFLYDFSHLNDFFNYTRNNNDFFNYFFYLNYLRHFDYFFHYFLDNLNLRFDSLVIIWNWYNFLIVHIDRFFLNNWHWIADLNFLDIFLNDGNLILQNNWFLYNLYSFIDDRNLFDLIHNFRNLYKKRYFD